MSPETAKRLLAEIEKVAQAAEVVGTAENIGIAVKEIPEVVCNAPVTSLAQRSAPERVLSTQTHRTAGKRA